MVVAMPRRIGARCGLNWTTIVAPAGERELLLDLGEVPVLDQAVGLGALGPLDEEVLLVDLAAGAADAAERIDDDVLARRPRPAASSGASGTSTPVG